MRPAISLGWETNQNSLTKSEEETPEARGNREGRNWEEGAGQPVQNLCEMLVQIKGRSTSFCGKMFLFVDLQEMTVGLGHTRIGIKLKLVAQGLNQNFLWSLSELCRPWDTGQMMGDLSYLEQKGSSPEEGMPASVGPLPSNSRSRRHLLHTVSRLSSTRC